jgi:hypothetical protein
LIKRNERTAAEIRDKNEKKKIKAKNRTRK